MQTTVQKSPTAIRVVLADDHELFRDGFSVMIRKQPDIDLIGEAADGEELLRLCQQLQPDVIITDIKMPRMDGIAFMHRVKKELPHTGVITLTQFEEEALIAEMLEAGAKGYLLKSANKEELVEAIKKVYEGKTHYCFQTRNKITQLISTNGFNPYRKPQKLVFNERETSIIRLICQGFTNREIAAQLFLSKRTIETHRENILHKMKVDSTAALIVYAMKNGIYKG